MTNLPVQPVGIPSDWTCRKQLDRATINATGDQMISDRHRPYIASGTASGTVLAEITLVATYLRNASIQ